jgi:DNA-binding PadR family transcriptional regulator
MYIVNGCIPAGAASAAGHPSRNPPVTDAKGLDELLPLTPVAFHILVSLADGPRHGYAIAQEVEELTDGRVVMGPGTLYGSLQRMLASHLIEEANNPGQVGLHSERRRYYRMSALGRAALRSESERLFRAVRVARERLGA